MTPEPWPQGVDLDVFDSIDSTQSEARRRLAAGATGPGWIVARRQTEGHGRRGRTWESPAGNLAATWYGRPSIPIAQAPQAGFAAALAVADLTDRWLPGRCLLKWPNDPLVDGAKIAGILPDTASRADGQLDWLMVGIGINLTHAPRDVPYPATSISALLGGERVDLDIALSILANAWHRRMHEWRRDGFSTVRAAWMARAHGLGAPLDVRLPNEAFGGIFEGLDESGALLVRLADGRLRAVAAGDVFPVSVPR